MNKVLFKDQKKQQKRLFRNDAGNFVPYFYVSNKQGVNSGLYVRLPVKPDVG